jgi:hypothetical protein
MTPFSNRQTHAAHRLALAAAVYLGFGCLGVVCFGVVCLGATPAVAGPCSSDIAKFVQAVRQSAGNPNAGPRARQSIAAQIDRQPTPASIRRAQARALALFEAKLARAKRLNALGDPACTHALAQAEDMYSFQ